MPDKHFLRGMRTGRARLGEHHYSTYAGSFPRFDDGLRSTEQNRGPALPEAKIHHPQDIQTTRPRHASITKEVTVSSHNVAILGPIAGFTIMFGLPIGRLRSSSASLQHVVAADIRFRSTHDEPKRHVVVSVPGVLYTSNETPTRPQHSRSISVAEQAGSRPDKLDSETVTPKRHRARPRSPVLISPVQYSWHFSQ